MSTFDKSRALWKATPWELYFALSHDNYSDLTCYCLTVGTVKSLQYDQVHSTLLHLYRQVPNLRVCQERDETGQLWTCWMKQEKVLLEFSEESDKYEEMYIQHTRRQHCVLEGPMWRVSVVPVSQAGVDAAVAAEGFHHQYHVMFGFHHAITDGHSSMRICGHFLKLLNDVLENNSIDDSQQLAEFHNGSLSDEIEKEVVDEINNTPGLKDSFLCQIKKLNNIVPLLFTAFPSNDANPKTCSISWDLSKDLTKAFVTKAKSERVTVHSAFCTLMNATSVELLNDAGLKNESYDVTPYHDINKRRYWKKNGDTKFGVHIGCHKSLVSVPRNVMDDFWGQARQFHEKFHAEIKDNYSMKMEMIERELSPPIVTAEDFAKNKAVARMYYAISNMGEITNIFRQSDGSDYSSARGLHIRRTTAVHAYNGTSTYCIQSLNGRLMITFDYNTRYHNHETAQSFFDKAREILKKLFPEIQ